MKLTYTLVVSGAPYGTQQATSAYQFAQALIRKGHRLESVFFYQEGVLNANRFVSPASDEFNLVNAWRLLAKSSDVVLNVCVAAALRRGVIDAKEALAQDEQGENLEEGFTLSGLGTLAQSALMSDRVVQF